MRHLKESQIEVTGLSMEDSRLPLVVREFIYQFGLQNKVGLIEHISTYPTVIYECQFHRKEDMNILLTKEVQEFKKKNDIKIGLTIERQKCYIIVNTLKQDK